MLIDFGLVGFTGLLIYEGVQYLPRIPIFRPKVKSPYILYSGKVKFDMKKVPHILISGLSGQGKSMFVTSLLRGRRDIDIILLNVFIDDLRGVKGRRVNNPEAILNFLEHLLDTKKDKPLYVVIDELLALSITNKNIIKQLTKILAVARHFNVFVIAISQSATKEEIGSKSLFNCRVCFKMVEYSSYSTVLGYSPEDKQLQVREYYYLTTEQGRGKVPRLTE